MKPYQKILAFISLAIACFLTVLDSTIVNVSLPSMATFYQTDVTGISWVSTAYLIPFSALLINFSKISDMFGRKRLFLLGLILFGSASALCGLSTTLPGLIAARALQGVGAAILTPLSIPLGINLFGRDSMSKLGIIIGMIISISAASGPVIGGLLTAAFGFQSIFYVNLPFIIVSFCLGAPFLQECFDQTLEKKIDWVGSILLAYGIGALTFSLVKGNSYGWSSPLILALLISSAIAMLLFIRHEFRSPNPMIEFSLFKIKSFSASILVVATIFFSYMPVSYMLNFYLETQLAYSAVHAGMMLSIVSCISFCMSPIFGLIEKKYGAKVISLLAVTFVTLGNLNMIFMTDTNCIRVILTTFILMGLGIGSTSPLYRSAFAEVSPDKNGNASGILNSLRQLTACLAIALVSTLGTHFTTDAIAHTNTRMTEWVQGTQVIQTLAKADIDEHFSHIKMEEMNKVYNKCFLIVGLISPIGYIAAFHNSKRSEFIHEEQQIT